MSGDRHPLVDGEITRLMPDGTKPPSAQRVRKITASVGQYVQHVLDGLASMQTPEQITYTLMDRYSIRYDHALSIVSAVTETMLVARTDMMEHVVRSLLMAHQASLTTVTEGIAASRGDDGTIEDQKSALAWERIRQTGIRNLTALLPQTHIIHADPGTESVAARLCAIYGVQPQSQPPDPAGYLDVDIDEDPE